MVCSSMVLVLGLTFKEDCSDIRNTKVMDIVNELQEYGLTVQIWDPVANKHEARVEYGVELLDDWRNLEKVDAVIAAVAHEGVRSISLVDLAAHHR